MKKAHVVLILLQILNGSRFSYSAFCIVNSSVGSCVAECNRTITVNEIQENIANFSEIELILCSRNYSLHSTIIFSNKISVSIAGVAGRSQLHCLFPNTSLYFQHVGRVTIANIAMRHCKVGEIGALVFTNSVDITISNAGIWGSSGRGMLLSNNTGYVKVSDSDFDTIYPSKYDECGVGLLVESTSNISTEYYIDNCTFANITSKVKSCSGLKIYLREAHTVKVAITQCNFTNNTGWQSAALSISLLNSFNVSVLVDKTNFTNNFAGTNGGAVLVSLFHDNMPLRQNKILFSMCNFTGNKAWAGGGVFLNSSFLYSTNLLSQVNFKNCNWNKNIANYGSAAFLSPHTSLEFFDNGKLPTPIFEDCVFFRNRNSDTILGEDSSNSSYNKTRYGIGALYLNSVNIELHGNIKFIENINSAVYLFSSRMKVTSNSCIHFIHNKGYRGGAINLRGVSSINVNDNISLSFDSNTAQDRGGAIYHEAFANPSNLSVGNCFLKYYGSQTVHQRNISVDFTNNRINANGSYRGQSIFLFSVLPCSQTGSNFFEAVRSIANFSFRGNSSNYQKVAIGTSASRFNIHRNLVTKLIPGKETNLNISLIDDTDFLIKQPVYKVGVISENNSITVSPGYAIVADNVIKLCGVPGSVGSIVITGLNRRDTSISFEIILQECPPGYLHDKAINACVCSANTNTLYLGIQRCNLTTFQANLIQGYWAGYRHSDSEKVSADKFRTSNCPLGYCTNEEVYYKPEISLPATLSVSKLNKLICNYNREGVLCAYCKNGTSVFYHTQGTFSCIKNRLCKWGILFFILSEIIPATVLFILLIFLDIQLTTGALDGFLLYMQIFSSLLVNGNNLIAFPKTTKVLLVAFNFIVKIFNLNFFDLPSLSYCLFEGANSLHVLAFDYVTVIYSLLLIALTVAVLNQRCIKIGNCLGPRRKYLFSSSIIHGLSGFLVMCYARTTLISLRILTPTRLYGKGQERYDLVAFYYGEIELFSKEHMKFAIPALFALVFVTLLPPLLLLIYPLCYKILSLLRLEESTFANILCKLLPLEKFKPFFDSIQSAFKDKHRYFAGLYFCYRMSTLLIFVIAKNLTEFYFLLELQFIIMLAIHAWVQPYKKNWHNQLNLYIFALLTVINGITLYNYHQTISLTDYQSVITVLSGVQIILAYSPLIFMISYLLHKLRFYHLLAYAGKRCHCKKHDHEGPELSLSICEEREVEMSQYQINYQKVD